MTSPALALWRTALSAALHRNRSLAYSRYVQLATVRPNGRPANRTIVFRGFLEQSNQLKFVTDRRSEKAEQIVTQSWGEVCWYFPKSREQFRLMGRLTLVGEDHNNEELMNARQHQWQDLSDAARTQFAWSDPGQVRSAEDAFDPPLPDPVHPLPHFCLLLLDPVQVDHLELKGDPQNRHLYTLEPAQTDGDLTLDSNFEAQQWSVQEVNP